MAETNYLADILILLAAAIIAVPVFQRMGLGSVLGYLAAGAIIGPWGFSFIDQIDEIRHIAEFGVIFLLFIIGIGLKPAQLWAMRRTVLGLGTAQILVTGLAITGVALALDQSLKLAVIIGFGLALSSTAIGLQILTERGEMGTSHGRTTLGVLLSQDLAVVPLLALVSLLNAETTNLLEGIEFAILEAVVIIALVIVVGRYLLSPILRLVATSRTAEVFTAAALFAVLGTAWLMEAAGLSLALGAFVAGVMMAESQYRHQVSAAIDPFRGILLGLFFMAVGMSINFGIFGQYGVVIVGLVFGLLLMKSLIIWVLSRLMRISAPDATRASLLLSQSGEFGFVIFGLAAITGLLPEQLFHILILVVALSMVTTPLMPKLGDFLIRHLTGAAGQHDISDHRIDEEQPRVIIAGFGRVGRRVARLLQAANITYLAVDISADRVLAGRQDGFSVVYGDASQADLLKAAGAGDARVVVCTLDRTVPAARMINILRENYPDLAIFARGHNREHCDQLLNAGASIVIFETLEASLQLGSAVLNTMGIPEGDATALIDSMRNKYYG